jgi:HEAT repeat protein
MLWAPPFLSIHSDSGTSEFIWHAVVSLSATLAGALLGCRYFEFESAGNSDHMRADRRLTLTVTAVLLAFALFSAFAVPRWEIGFLIPKLIPKLNDEDPSIRATATAAVIHLGAKAQIETLPFLISSLCDSHGNVRSAAFLAMVSLGTNARKEAIPVLISMLEEQGPRPTDPNFVSSEWANVAWKRQTAAFTIVGLGEDGVLEIVQHPDPSVRRKFAKAFVEFRTPFLIPDYNRAKAQVIAALNQLLEDHDANVRAQAAESLKRIALWNEVETINRPETADD